MTPNNWQKTHKEEYNTYKRKWYNENKEKMAAYVKKYRHKDIEKSRAKARELYHKNKDRRKVEYLKAHPLIQKECIICGKPFETRSKNKKVCGIDCRIKRQAGLLHDYYEQNKADLREYKRKYAKDHYKRAE